MVAKAFQISRKSTCLLNTFYERVRHFFLRNPNTCFFSLWSHCLIGFQAQLRSNPCNQWDVTMALIPGNGGLLGAVQCQCLHKQTGCIGKADTHRKIRFTLLRAILENWLSSRWPRSTNCLNCRCTHTHAIIVRIFTIEDFFYNWFAFCTSCFDRFCEETESIVITNSFLHFHAWEAGITTMSLCNSSLKQ